MYIRPKVKHLAFPGKAFRAFMRLSVTLMSIKFSEHTMPSKVKEKRRHISASRDYRFH